MLQPLDALIQSMFGQIEGDTFRYQMCPLLIRGNAASDPGGSHALFGQGLMPENFDVQAQVLQYLIFLIVPFVAKSPYNKWRPLAHIEEGIPDS